jgi:hypothetical protein
MTGWFVTYMLQTLTWPTLQQRRLKTKLIMFYKIVHHIVAVLTTILIPTDPRIRQFHPFTYRHLHAFKYPYKYSFFPSFVLSRRCCIVGHVRVCSISVTLLVLWYR